MHKVTFFGVCLFVLTERFEEAPFDIFDFKLTWLIGYGLTFVLRYADYSTNTIPLQYPTRLLTRISLRYLLAATRLHCYDSVLKAVRTSRSVTADERRQLDIERKKKFPHVVRIALEWMRQLKMVWWSFFYFSSFSIRSCRRHSLPSPFLQHHSIHSLEQ